MPRGETVETEVEGQRRLIAPLNPELGLINLKDAMPLYIAASGPRARALTARLGGGWIDGAASVERAIGSLRVMRDAWTAAGQAADTLNSVAWAGGAVLDDGEPADSPRAVAQAGPRAMMLLHRAADAALGGYPDAGLPEVFAEAAAGYVAHARTFRPQGAHYLPTDDALMVNWFSIEILNAAGKRTYHNSFIIDLDITAANVGDLAACGRARWKIENETCNVLKAGGYNFEQNFGHGRETLASVLVVLNLLAFGFHTVARWAVLGWRDAVIAKGATCRFFEHLRTITVYVVFETWDHLLRSIADAAIRPP